MGNPLTEIEWQFASVYPDDRGLFSSYAALHMDYQENLSTIMREEDVSLKLSKCNFSGKKEYLNDSAWPKRIPEADKM